MNGMTEMGYIHKIQKKNLFHRIFQDWGIQWALRLNSTFHKGMVELVSCYINIHNLITGHLYLWTALVENFNLVYYICPQGRKH